MQAHGKTYKFIGKVLPDGHLSIPEEVAKSKVDEFEVTLTPLDDIKKMILLYRNGLIEKKGAINDIELDSERIAEAVRKNFGATNIDDIIESVRK